MPKVLVVDDDHTVREVVVSYLRAHSHEVVEAADGEEALKAMRADPADLVVLDLMLPGIDGLEVCRQLRETSDVPVIMLTALGSETDRVVGLERGADDYVTKPFSPRELALRVDSVLRRVGESEAPRAGRVTDGDLVVDNDRHAAYREGAELPLTSREFDLLRFLVGHPGQAFSRDELLQQVWGWSFGDQSTVTVHVRRLREKVEPDPTMPVRLVTVWGVGYRWEAAVTSDQVEIVLITAAWSGGVGFVGLLLAWTQRHRSLRVLTAGVAVVAVAAVLAGMLGDGPRHVPVDPRLRGDAAGLGGGRVGRDRVRGRGRSGVLCVVARPARRGQEVRRQRRVRVVGRRPGRAAGAVGGARPHERAAARVTRARGAARGEPARAGLLGLPRPAYAAGRSPRDDRGPGGRAGRGPRALLPPDAQRGGPDGPDGRRPLRAVADPRGCAEAVAPAGGLGRPGQRGAGRGGPDRARAPRQRRWPGRAGAGSRRGPDRAVRG